MACDRKIFRRIKERAKEKLLAISYKVFGTSLCSVINHCWPCEWLAGGRCNSFIFMFRRLSFGLIVMKRRIYHGYFKGSIFLGNMSCFKMFQFSINSVWWIDVHSITSPKALDGNDPEWMERSAMRIRISKSPYVW